MSALSISKRQTDSGQVEKKNLPKFTFTQFIEHNHPLKKPPQPPPPELKVISNTIIGNVILGPRRSRKTRMPKDRHAVPDSIPGLGPRRPNPHTAALVLSLGDDLPSSPNRGRQHEEAAPAF